MPAPGPHRALGPRGGNVSGLHQSWVREGVSTGGVGFQAAGSDAVIFSNSRGT